LLILKIILKREVCLVLTMLLKIVFSALKILVFVLTELVLLRILLVEGVLLMLKSWLELINLLLG
jgi:hypothetical protein